MKFQFFLLLIVYAFSLVYATEKDVCEIANLDRLSCINISQCFYDDKLKKCVLTKNV